MANKPTVLVVGADARLEELDDVVVDQARLNYNVAVVEAGSAQAEQCRV